MEVHEVPYSELISSTSNWLIAKKIDGVLKIAQLFSGDFIPGDLLCRILVNSPFSVPRKSQTTSNQKSQQTQIIRCTDKVAKHVQYVYKSLCDFFLGKNL